MIHNGGGFFIARGIIGSCDQVAGRPAVTCNLRWKLVGRLMNRSQLPFVVAGHRRKLKPADICKNGHVNEEKEYRRIRKLKFATTYAGITPASRILYRAPRILSLPPPGLWLVDRGLIFLLQPFPLIYSLILFFRSTIKIIMPVPNKACPMPAMPAIDAFNPREIAAPCTVIIPRTKKARTTIPKPTL